MCEILLPKNLYHCGMFFHLPLFQVLLQILRSISLKTNLRNVFFTHNLRSEKNYVVYSYENQIIKKRQKAISKNITNVVVNSFVVHTVNCAIFFLFFLLELIIYIY